MLINMVDLNKIQSLLGVEFDNTDILLSAITHRSYLNEHKEATWEHNERLEFLGDAVLELVVTDFLFRKYKNKPEGELTAVRAALVNTISLSKASESLGINDFLLMSKGESKDRGRARQCILANTFEACIGAIYLDKGYETAGDFIFEKLNLEKKADNIVKNSLWRDVKSRFQELSQEKLSFTPVYKTLNQEGPDHNRRFTVGVYVNDELISTGVGFSKQEAERSAAVNAMKNKGWT